MKKMLSLLMVISCLCLASSGLSEGDAPRQFKVFTLGNSLTCGNGFGMAASEFSKAWFPMVCEYIESNRPDSLCNKIQGNKWEGGTSEERKLWVDEQLIPAIDPETAIFFIQLGDNLNTEERRTTFREDADYMVGEIKTKAPDATLYWIGCWYTEDRPFDDIFALCEKYGITFIDIRDLKNDEANRSYVGAEITLDDGTVITVDEAAVASHPGDAGMYAIYERVVEVLNLEE